MNIVTENRNVLLRLEAWKPRMVQSEMDDLEVEYIVPPTDPGYVRINDNLEIIPLTEAGVPNYDVNFKQLAGPYYNFTESTDSDGNTVVTAAEYYNIIDASIDHIKANLSTIVTANRYVKENAGLTTVIQGVTVTVDTARDNRNFFVQKLMLMSDSDTVLWKFPECWLTLTKAELEAAVLTAAVYIQEQFNDECNKLALIASAPTIADLEAIVL